MVEFQEILFKDILRFTQYPGAPFTGDPTYDLVSYFFVPMVFIIFFTYMLLGRIVTNKIAWLRMLLGAALFMYMIVNGWFAIFALLSGSYFIFLIVILGGFYFLPSHFSVRHSGGGGGGGGSAPTGGYVTGDIQRGQETFNRMQRGEHETDIGRMRYLKEEIKRLESETKAYSATPGGEKIVERLGAKREAYIEELRLLESRYGRGIL